MARPLKETVQEVDLSLIDEPRGSIRIEIEDEALSELAQSISESGLHQPIILRKKGDRFEVVFGHRRYLAHKKLDLSHIKAIVRKMSDQEAAVSRATENLSRVDLTPVEEAATYKDLIDNHGMSIEQVAVKMAKTPGTIKRRMDILKMHPLLQQAVHRKQISMSVAEELWPISDATDLEYYLMFAIENGATREVARAWCKEWKDLQRRKQVEPAGDTVERAPNEPRPIYISCEICAGPVELGKDKFVRMCPACWETIGKV